MLEQVGGMKHWIHRIQEPRRSRRLVNPRWLLLSAPSKCEPLSALFITPPAAAAAALSSCHGWTFWKCRCDHRWVSLHYSNTSWSENISSRNITGQLENSACKEVDQLTGNSFISKLHFYVRCLPQLLANFEFKKCIIYGSSPEFLLQNLGQKIIRGGKNPYNINLYNIFCDHSYWQSHFFGHSASHNLFSSLSL